MRAYQHDFSLHSHAVHDDAGRRRKAATIARVLRDAAGDALAAAAVLDVGASTGTIDAALVDGVGRIVGIDIDAPAIRQAQARYAHPRLVFRLGDAMQLDFPDASFDVVVCAHVYEHVPDAERLMAEIERVLKPGGLCHFTAGNRLALIEPHYRLALLSVMPKPLAHVYLRLRGRGRHYYETHLSYWALKRLVRRFDRLDYTRRLIAEPERFATAYMIAPGSLKQRLALWLFDHAEWLCPGYVWVLRKPSRAHT